MTDFERAVDAALVLLEARRRAHQKFTAGFVALLITKGVITFGDANGVLDALEAGDSANPEEHERQALLDIIQPFRAGLKRSRQ